MLTDREVAARTGAWGECRVLGKFPGGYRNSALLVECGGSRFVAKSSRRSAEAIAWLEPVQEIARNAGLVVPHFLPSKHGERLVDGVTLESWIEGTPASGGDVAALTKPIKQFHSSTASWRQRPGFASSLDLIELERGGDVDLSLMPSELVEACRSAWRELSGERLSVVHGDLNPSNLLLTPEGRLALLDWDEARVDVSILDEVALTQVARQAEARQARARRALLAWEVAVSWLLEPDHAKRLARQLLPGKSSR